jgi:DNA-binding NtrC family response regulator
MERLFADMNAVPLTTPLRPSQPVGWDDGAGPNADPLPKLRELREDVFFRAEYNYLRNLVSLCGHNIKKACQVSGLSRSRLYSLLKKYQLSTSLHTPCPQK